MRWTLMASSPTRLLVLLTLIATVGLGLSVAGAQTSSQSVTSGYGQYYVEFRSRQAWDYGHTFVVFGRVGETPGKKNVAGLSPKGDDPKMWLMGHYMPVPRIRAGLTATLRTGTSLRATACCSIRTSTTESSPISGSCNRARTSGALRCTTAMPSSLTSRASWDLRYRPQVGFIRGCL